MKKNIIQMAPNITVITVVFNAVGTIQQTIDSIVAQTYESFEYIIIDGGSTDGTIEIVKKYQDKIALFISEPDRGIYDAMNKGVKLAKGNYIYFIGGDDILCHNSILASIGKSLLKRNTIYYGNVLYKNRNIIYDGRFNSFKIVTRNICHQSIFYPSEIFKEYQYDTAYKIYADYALNLKLFNHRIFRFEYIPLTIAIFCEDGLSGMQTIDVNFERDRLAIIKKHFPFVVYFYRICRTKMANLLKLR